MSVGSLAKKSGTAAVSISAATKVGSALGSSGPTAQYAVTLRYRSRLYHVAVGRRHERTRVLILVADRDIRVLTNTGQLLRHLALDPSRLYQPLRA